VAGGKDQWMPGIPGVRDVAAVGNKAAPAVGAGRHGAERMGVDRERPRRPTPPRGSTERLLPVPPTRLPTNDPLRAGLLSIRAVDGSR
jgi:hypothetical protein